LGSESGGSLIVGQLNPPLILPMDSRLMPRSGARVDAAQTHRFPEFLNAPKQPHRDGLKSIMGFC
jgi:hypothetical protein